MPKKNINFEEMSQDERVALVEQIYVIYPKLERLLSRIDHCREFSKIAAEPEGMLITGPQGQGKTTLRKHYAQMFPRKIDGNRIVLPVLTIGILVPATVKSLASRLLDALGDPAADRGTTANQTLRLYKYLKHCEVELIILDEFQHFIDRESLKVLRTISDWLKMLMNDTGVPIVLIGMPKSEAVLDEKENAQLKRRFPTRDSLEPFGWSNIEEQNDFRKFLKLLDEKLPLRERSYLCDTDIAYRIHCATGGVINYVMKLIRRAASCAIQQQKERLEMELLAQAFEERIAHEKPNMPNPFHDGSLNRKGKSGATHSASSRTATGCATNKRVKGRKKEVPLSTVLTQRQS